MKSIEKADYSSAVIREVFEDYSFSYCNFDNATLQDCKFIDCKFSDCTLNTIHISSTVFFNVDFDCSKLMGINWTKSKWEKIILSSPINFYSCNISYSSFFGLNLPDIKIQKCKVHNVDFRESNLSNGDFSHSDLSQSIFIHTKLTEADLSEAVNYNIDITLNDVRGAVFTFPEVVNLLKNFEIKIKGIETN